MRNVDATLTTSTGASDGPARSGSVIALWHLLSLDAPCVAALWTVFVAHVFRVPLTWTAPSALAVAVWMLYVADRLADAAAGKAFEERHRFHQRHSTVFAVGWLLCAPLLLLLVVHLPHALRDGWLLLAVPLAAYVGTVHALRLGHVPKEPLIAVFFGMAIAMPEISSGSSSQGLLRSVALFALLCWMNCAAIGRWEAPLSGYLDPATHFLGRRLSFCTAVAILLSLWIALHEGPARWIGAAIAASLVLLFLLGQVRGRMDRTQLRALADVALLTPLMMLPLLAWLGR